PNGGCIADAHFVAPIMDAGAGLAVSISGNATSCGGWQKRPSITITNGHFTTTAGVQIYLHNAGGVSVIGGDCSLGGGGTVCAQIDGATSTGNLVEGLSMQGPGVCVETTGGATGNTIANNHCTGVSGNAVTTGFLSTGSGLNSWVGNAVGGYFTTGYSYDST